MKTMESERLLRPVPVRFEQGQDYALRDISRRNHGIRIAKLNRIAVDFLIRLTDLNGGIVPIEDSVRVQRRFARRMARKHRRNR